MTQLVHMGVYMCVCMLMCRGVAPWLQDRVAAIVAPSEVWRIEHFSAVALPTGRRHGAADVPKGGSRPMDRVCPTG